jgi:hypothetical protein
MLLRDWHQAAELQGALNQGLWRDPGTSPGSPGSWAGPTEWAEAPPWPPRVGTSIHCSSHTTFQFLNVVLYPDAWRRRFQALRVYFLLAHYLCIRTCTWPCFAPAEMVVFSTSTLLASGMALQYQVGTSYQYQYPSYVRLYPYMSTSCGVFVRTLWPREHGWVSCVVEWKFAKMQIPGMAFLGRD